MWLPVGEFKVVGLLSVVVGLQFSLIEPLTRLTEQQDIPVHQLQFLLGGGGLLLWGPPGCGKTHLVHAVCSSAPANFLSIQVFWGVWTRHSFPLSLVNCFCRLWGGSHASGKRASLQSHR